MTASPVALDNFLRPIAAPDESLSLSLMTTPSPRAERVRVGSPLTFPHGRSPQPAKAAAVAEQPIKGDERVAVLDGAGVEHGFDLGQSLDHDPDVLALRRQAVHAGCQGRIDPGAK